VLKILEFFSAVMKLETIKFGKLLTYRLYIYDKNIDVRSPYFINNLAFTIDFNQKSIYLM